MVIPRGAFGGILPGQPANDLCRTKTRQTSGIYRHQSSSGKRKAERAIRTLMDMWHPIICFKDKTDRRIQMIRFINFYNTVKPHKHIGGGFYCQVNFSRCNLPFGCFSLVVGFMLRDYCYTSMPFRVIEIHFITP